MRVENRGGRAGNVNASVSFSHSFNSSAGISAIFNVKCHKMSSQKMSLGKDWRVTSNLPYKTI